MKIADCSPWLICSYEPHGSVYSEQGWRSQEEIEPGGSIRHKVPIVWHEALQYGRVRPVRFAAKNQLTLNIMNRSVQQLDTFFGLRFKCCWAAGLGLPTLVNLSSSQRTFCRVLSISS